MILYAETVAVGKTNRTARKGSDSQLKTHYSARGKVQAIVEYSEGYIKVTTANNVTHDIACTKQVAHT